MTTVTTRAGKGSALTYAEMDANFTNLNNDKVETSAIANMLETSDIGVSVQAYSANLDEYAAVNPTTAGLALLDDANAAAQRTTLGLGTAATMTGPSGTIVGTTDTQTLTNKTIGLAGALDCNNNVIQEIKTATFNSQATLTTTTGAVTVDWSAAQNYKQNEPTGSITYTFTAPPGPCHLQLWIDSDGTSSAQTFTWPGTVIWFGTTWTAVANKKAVINFWYDGTNYSAMGANQV